MAGLELELWLGLVGLIGLGLGLVLRTFERFAQSVDSAALPVDQ